ncbi:hypothetical protein [Ectothiorhodosinus mongolicus]|nr:hypothetical protein [Ectothiorhodosinus mongolicus]ULX56775.1 hypothetical protein CKX93_03050 [Ectothiorhodosinus mongolicus]
MFAIISLAVSGNAQFITSYLLFLTFLLWPFLLRKKDFNYKNYNHIIKIYVIGVIFCAVGVLFQVYSFFILGNEVFRVALFGGGRIAFSFLWKDFSFLSLYFVSAIPLVFIIFSRWISIFVSVLLLVASVLTSARTGIAALILFCFFYLIYALFRSTVTGTLSKNSIFLGISIFIIVGFLVFVLSAIGVRQVTLASTGRVESVMQAIHYWMAFPLFGSWMDPVRYDSGTIPHHILTYSLVMGGLVFSSLFFLWLFSAYHIIFSKNKFIFYSIVIALLGFNFIPSFFSAYFLAFLFSLSIFYGQVYRNISY